VGAAMDATVNALRTAKDFNIWGKRGEGKVKMSTLATIMFLMMSIPLLSSMLLEQKVTAQFIEPFGNFSTTSNTTTTNTTTTTETLSDDQSGLLKVELLVFGIDDATGNIVTFVTAQNLTKAFAGSGQEIDRLDNQSDGIGEVFYTFPELTMNPGDKFEACAVTVNDHGIQCASGLKGPSNRTEVSQLLLTPQNTSVAN
jgi:hypothetical protein